MDKKQFTSWGVSFGSLALIAGMMSYLGFTNKGGTTNKVNKTTAQTQAANQNKDQPSSFQNGNDQNSFGDSSNDNGLNSNFGDDQSTTDEGSSVTGNNDSTDTNGQSLFNNDSTGQSDNQFNNDNSGQSNNQLSGRSFGHHRGYDTTTGGT